MIFVTALGVIVVLTGLVLVFAQAMRTEMIASANRLSYAQADAIEQGAERWVMAEVESNPGDAVTIMQAPAQAVSIGGGYFWVIRPDPDSDQNYAYGIADEAGKLSLNGALPEQLALLPNMTNDIADSIITWRGGDDTEGLGAESDYYESLADPYALKAAPFETVEELLLIKDVTPALLYGGDINHDGVVTAAEQSVASSSSIMGSSSASFGGSGGARGLFNDITCFSIEPNTSRDGAARANVNNRDTSALQTVLRASLSNSKASDVLGRVISAQAAARGRPAFSDIGAFYTTSGLSASDFGLIADQVSTTSNTTTQGLVNVMTASREVLATLPGLDSSDADTLVSAQAGADSSSIAWVFNALPEKAPLISGSITNRSFQYSADIVAVSGDGRAFKRVRIVVDAQATPSKVVYRKDLTSLGWPLPAEIRTQLRAGQGVNAGVGAMAVSR